MSKDTYYKTDAFGVIGLCTSLADKLKWIRKQSDFILVGFDTAQIFTALKGV